jgi:hypothetical protein
MFVRVEPDKIHICLLLIQRRFMLKTYYPAWMPHVLRCRIILSYNVGQYDPSLKHIVPPWGMV